MGFEAKILFVGQRVEKAYQPGPQKETDCTMWEDLSLGIDFQHITRLEKVVGQRFKHLTHTPFRRAGICVMDCFLGSLFKGEELAFTKHFAPEILIPEPMLWTDNPPDATITTGGRTYLNCPEYRLRGRVGNEDWVQTHNLVVGMDQKAMLEYASKRWNILEPPLLWAPCADLAKWLTEAEEKNTPSWQGLAQDRTTLAIVRGWRHLLRELGETEGRAVFRFS